MGFLFPAMIFTKFILVLPLKSLAFDPEKFRYNFERKRFSVG